MSAALDNLSRPDLARAVYASRTTIGPSAHIDAALDLIAAVEDAEAASLPLIARVRGGERVAGALRDHDAIIADLRGKAMRLKADVARCRRGERGARAAIDRLAALAVADAEATIARLLASVDEASRPETMPGELDMSAMLA